MTAADERADAPAPVLLVRVRFVTPGGAPPRRDGVYKHERDAETDCEPDGD